MAGIHRSVELIRRPAGADIVDYTVQADASGHITCHVECRRPTRDPHGRRPRRIVAQLYDDQPLDADGDAWKKGTCVWTASHELNDSNHFSTINCNLSGDVAADHLRLWSAETPHLYTLVVSVETAEKDGSAVVKQAESCRVGFRTVDIHNGAVHVNGKPITVCGMNRHEHDPDHGKVISLERMKQDICLLK